MNDVVVNAIAELWHFYDAITLLIGERVNETIFLFCPREERTVRNYLPP